MYERVGRLANLVNLCLIWTTLAFSRTALLQAADTPSSIAVGQVVRETGIDRGVCCMVGFDADVALQLVQSTNLLVHILDTNATTVAHVRQIAEDAAWALIVS